MATWQNNCTINSATKKRSLRKCEHIPHKQQLPTPDVSGGLEDDYERKQPVVSVKHSLADQEDDDDELMAECVSNGFKLVQCLICAATMHKIYQLRQHLKSHECPENYANEGKCLESTPIYELLNPNNRNIEASTMRDFIISELHAKRHSQLYVILSEASEELHISDSETESDADKRCFQQTMELHRLQRKRLYPRRSYKCLLCQKTFDRRHKALFHQRTAHANAVLPLHCDYCGRSFCAIPLLIHHLKTRCESDEQPTSCVERFRQYLIKENLEQFECLTQARKDLKEHRLTTAAKVYACSVCQKTFVRSEHLSRHKVVHLPEELKLECRVCWRRFNRKDNLRSHMKVHENAAERDNSTEQASILCQYCGYCFNSNSNYVVHMRRKHTGSKPFVCDVCGKGFPKSTDLKTHRVKHTTCNREFSCSLCEKTFAHSAALAKHMRVHGAPFQCAYCVQSYQRPNELAQHLRQHAANMQLEKPELESDQLKVIAESQLCLSQQPKACDVELTEVATAVTSMQESDM